MSDQAFVMPPAQTTREVVVAHSSITLNHDILLTLRSESISIKKTKVFEEIRRVLERKIYILSSVSGKPSGKIVLRLLDSLMNLQQSRLADPHSLAHVLVGKRKSSSRSPSLIV